MRVILKFVLTLLLSAAASAQTASTTVSVGWAAPTANTDGSTIASCVLSYNLYQGAKGGTFTKVASGLTAVSTTVTSLAAGNCFAITAVEAQSGGGSIESALSPTVCALQADSPTGLSVSVTITVH